MTASAYDAYSPPVLYQDMNDDEAFHNTTVEWYSIASDTFKYSATCSAGFFLALAISLAIFMVMACKQRRQGESDPLLWYDLDTRKNGTGNGNGWSSDGSKSHDDSALEEQSDATRNMGRFGKFMICVELLDAIPESAIIADAAVQGSISWAFVLAILALNVCNGFATSMDFLSNNRDTGTQSLDVIRSFLFIFIFFAVGILSYSISANIYSSFVGKYDDTQRDYRHLLLLFLGTVMGGVLILTIMRVEDWLHHKSDNAGEVGPKPSFWTRVGQLILIFSVIFIWTVVMTFGLAAVFWLFVEHNKSAFIESALEGLSGGAFLATVAGTMIPRIQEDALSIPWSEVRKKMVGVCMFELGIIIGVTIDVVT